MTIFDGLVFSEKDIKDLDRLERMIETESLRIYHSDESNRGRSLDQIFQKVKQGKIAELYLIENFNYSEADILWHDLLDSNGVYTEVKAYSKIWNEHAPQVIEDLKRYRKIEKFLSKWYILFSVDEKNFYKFIAKIRIKD